MNLHFKIKWLYSKFIADVPQYKGTVPEYPRSVWKGQGHSVVSRSLVLVNLAMFIHLYSHLSQRGKLNLGLEVYLTCGGRS